MITEKIAEKELPGLLWLGEKRVETLEEWNTRREEIRVLLEDTLMGHVPDFKTQAEYSIISEEPNSFGGKALTQCIEARIKSPFSYCSFTFTLTIPKAVENPPLFLCLSFTPQIADGLGEEIIDNGFGIANVYYEGIAPDKEDDFKNGAGRFARRNPYDSWGKISMWSWGASKMMDYLQKLDSIDTKRIAIIGHSRLGKTALWCGATDQRFSMVAAVQSGAGGAALYRGKTGERIANLAGKISRLWFCGNLFEYCNREEELPFDQHFVLSLVAPRNLYVASAAEDSWSDPEAEFLSCVAASEVYDKFYDKGLVCKDRLPEIGECLHEGRIGYHLKSGTHYFSRYDWNKIIDYRRKHNV